MRDAKGGRVSSASIRHEVANEKVEVDRSLSRAGVAGRGGPGTRKEEGSKSTTY